MAAFNLKTVPRALKDLKTMDVIAHLEGKNLYFYKVISLTAKGFWYHNCDYDGSLTAGCQKKWSKMTKSKAQVVSQLDVSQSEESFSQPEPAGEDPC
jgi:hypothetical protein